MKNTITPEEKLKLLEVPARRAINQLRIFADCGKLGISDEGECTLANMASWLEGVLDEHDAYMPWKSETARRTLTK